MPKPRFGVLYSLSRIFLLLICLICLSVCLPVSCYLCRGSVVWYPQALTQQVSALEAAKAAAEAQVAAASQDDDKAHKERLTAQLAAMQLELETKEAEARRQVTPPPPAHMSSVLLFCFPACNWRPRRPLSSSLMSSSFPLHLAPLSSLLPLPLPSFILSFLLSLSCGPLLLIIALFSLSRLLTQAAIAHERSVMLDEQKKLASATQVSFPSSFLFPLFTPFFRHQVFSRRLLCRRGAGFQVYVSRLLLIHLPPIFWSECVSEESRIPSRRFAVRWRR